MFPFFYHLANSSGSRASASSMIPDAIIFLARTGHSKEDIRDYIEQRFGYDLHKTYADWYGHYEWDEFCQGMVQQALICYIKSLDFLQN